jgi:phospholipid/cholesterol/gamma-HCH transport system permease protein
MKNSFPRFPRQELIREMYRVGVESLWIILVVSFVLTSALVYQTQASLGLARYGLAPMLGALTIGIARELIPLIVGLVIAARVGSAFAAEIASMKITEQIDALESLAVDPIEYLLFPRFLACLLMMVPLTILAWLASFFGGVWAGQLLGINLTEFMQTAREYFKYSFLVSGLIRSAVFGVLISIISCSSGFAVRETEKDVLGVGRATTRAVVISFVTIFLANLLFAWLFKY